MAQNVWEDSLEKEMATYSSILAWKIPMDRGAWQAIPYVLSVINRVLVTIYGEGNGTPLQYSCLENPMDGGAC